MNFLHYAENFSVVCLFAFFSKWPSLWMPSTFFEADQELFTGFWANPEFLFSEKILTDQT